MNNSIFSNLLIIPFYFDTPCHAIFQVSVKYMQNTRVCQSCHKGNIHTEYNDGKLYNQLFYLSHILDPNASQNEEVKKIRNKDPRWSDLLKESTKILANNAYAIVNILNLFSSGLDTGRSAAPPMVQLF